MGNIFNRIFKSKRVNSLQKPNKKHCLVFSAIFLSLTLSLLVGFVSNDSKKEQTAYYVSNVVKNNTLSSKYLGTIVQHSSLGANFSAFDNDAEFRRVYGVFRQERATFAAGYNLDKKYTVTIDIFSSPENHSIMWVGQSSSEKYGEGYKHNPFPYIFMFQLNREPTLTRYCLSISKSKATKILKELFPEKKESEFTDNDYREYVVGKTANINISGKITEYTIQDIYLEDGYYYECIKETVGDFIIFTDYFYPEYETGKILPSQRMYFFTDYTYQTKYFMDYLNATYSINDYDFEVATNNLVNKNIDKKTILAFREFSNSLVGDALSYVFILLAIMVAIISIALFVVFNVRTNKISICLCLISIFVPYLLFKILYYLTKNISFNSIIGTRINGILMIVFIVVFILASVFRITTNPKKVKNEFTPDVEI